MADSGVQRPVVQGLLLEAMNWMSAHIRASANSSSATGTVLGAVDCMRCGFDSWVGNSRPHSGGSSTLLSWAGGVASECSK